MRAIRALAHATRHKVKHGTRSILAHPFIVHGHHWAYVFYYGIAFVEERGARMVICGILLTFSLLMAIHGKEE